MSTAVTKNAKSPESTRVAASRRTSVAPRPAAARPRVAVHRRAAAHQREAARRFGIDPKTVAKMLRHAVPPGYRRTKAPTRPKLDAFTAIIDQILISDRSAPPRLVR